MRAYAVFDGGGVKGAALAGCLHAAETSGIEFQGFGGTSAGSIVALLASVGYSGDELRDIMCKDLPFKKLADELAGPLRALADIAQRISKPGPFLGPRLLRHKKLVNRVWNDLGVSNGNDLIDALSLLVSKKVKGLQRGFTFHDMAQAKCLPLKVLASDLQTRKPIVFSNAGNDEMQSSVLDAVRASISYPFAFQPVRVNDHYLVDGGLCSNLPIFLFNKEREEDRLPLIAFDLVMKEPERPKPHSGKQYCLDMLETSLESGDFLMRRVSEDLHHIKVSIPSDISALNFDLSEERLQQLFLLGESATNEYIRRDLEPWQQAGNIGEVLQAQYGKPDDVNFVLERFARHLEADTPMSNVRANVMLPTFRETRIVAYQYGMDEDSDQDLELAMDGGCSGACWQAKAIAWANLVDEGANHLDRRMTRAQQSKLRPDRKTMVSIPIFYPGSQTHLIGTLSADTDTHMDLLKSQLTLKSVHTIGRQWAVVLTSVLS